MEIKVYADAGSNLFKAILDQKKCDVKVVSMTLDVSGKIFKCYDDDIDVQAFSKDFYNELRKGSSVKTSLANPNAWADAFKEDIELGNKIICFTMASGISGTYQSACLAASMINSEKGEDVIKVIDSKTAGFGEGLQALHAAELIKKGLSFEDVCKECEDFVSKVRSEFTVGDIKYLSKTGRVSSIVARIASMLNIKAILKGSDEAKIVMMKKVHGRNMALKFLIDTCKEKIVDPDNQTVYISHCDDEEAALVVKNALVEAGIKNVEVYYYDLVTGSHVGPGTIAVFYVGENRN